MRHPSILICILYLLLAACQQEAKKADGEMTETDYLEQGRQIAQVSFSAVSSKLGKALEEGGVAKAIEYCNLNAIPIFDSLSLAHEVEIKRTSFQLRNPRNLPTVGERAALKKYQDVIDADNTPEPEVVLDEAGRRVFHAPIIIQPLCLKCHGVIGQDILDNDYQVIRSMYNNDRATGYSLGQLRGIWSITFPPSDQE